LDHLAVLKGITKAKERRESVRGLLRLTNLWEVRKQKLGTFSGGMRQRFGIAQALLGNPRLVIVDEPTAGLDPEERQRFLNLLSEIGENVVVILSTHIVDDVRVLCSSMAIIDQGRVLLTGKPKELVSGLSGKIWRKSIHKDELPHYRESFRVISSQLSAGRTLIHIYSEIPTADGFETVHPNLEDVYFSALKGALSPAC
ncbi:MAG: ATP-binding cassette domain-containing protein, partial [Planctomycetes bacterium]|nr:ATP-binding cassette domain-containing protein [Planctomycetota bacterium]